MKKISAFFVLISVLCCCDGRLLAEDPFAMGDDFTESFLHRGDPDQMSLYCDEAGRACIAEHFFAVGERSPRMYDYLLTLVRRMDFTYVRRPVELSADPLAATGKFTAGQSSGAETPSTGVDGKDIPVARNAPHNPDFLSQGLPAGPIVPPQVEELELVYDITSGKDPSYRGESRVFLRKNVKGRWRVCGCDYTLFW